MSLARARKLLRQMNLPMPSADVHTVPQEMDVAYKVFRALRRHHADAMLQLARPEAANVWLISAHQGAWLVSIRDGYLDAQFKGSAVLHAEQSDAACDELERLLGQQQSGFRAKERASRRSLTGLSERFKTVAHHVHRTKPIARRFSRPRSS